MGEQPDESDDAPNDRHEHKRRDDRPDSTGCPARCDAQRPQVVKLDQPRPLLQASYRVLCFPCHGQSVHRHLARSGSAVVRPVDAVIHSTASLTSAASSAIVQGKALAYLG